MSLLTKIKSIRTSDSITIYWQKQSAIPAGFSYQIYKNGNLEGITQKTHFTLSNLEANKEYSILVKMVQGEETESYIILDELHIKTEKKKLFLDITKYPYHAMGDGKTMNTETIQNAIDDCTEEQVVYVPPGIYMTGALQLHSGMELYLEKDAILQGTDDVADYLPKIWSRFEGIELLCYSSLLNLGELDHKGGYNCRNVIIRGQGTIASGGRSLAENVIALEKEQMKDYLLSMGDNINECEKPDTIPARVRPRLINISNSQNVILSGVTFRNGASWNVHMIYSDQIVTAGCTFYSEDVWNGDGWDPDSSSNCTIFNCVFYTGDDSIAIKSGKNPEGNRINRPSEHIRIFDCKCAYGHGITIGSEMSGGIQDVVIWDCDMSESLYGIEIKGTKKRGGYVRNIHIMDSAVSRILLHSVGYNDDGIAAPLPPVFENCCFEHVTVIGEALGHDREKMDCDAIELCGFDEPGHELSNIVFKDLTIGSGKKSKQQKITLQLCENLTFEHIHCL